MNYIAKCAPASVDAQGRCLIFAPSFAGAAPAVGDTIFVWFSETQGGSGLAHRGAVHALGDESPRPISVTIQATCKRGVLAKAQLQNARGRGQAGPIATIAGKLYTHAHNKVAELDADESEWLEQYFPVFDPTSATVAQHATQRDAGKPADLAAFERAMRGIYNEAAKLGYKPTEFMRMIESQGGLLTAKRLIASSTPSSGFTRLWELRRLDLTVEALALSETWSSLFEASDLAKARARLRQYDYKAV